MSLSGRLVRFVGLGLVAGAVLLSDASAQDTTRARRDTVRVRRDTTIRVPIPPQADTIVKRDSTAQRDSAVRARLARLAADSLKTPLARAELPVLVDVSRPVMRWDREALFATGALTLLDMLERIPGLTALRVGWMSAPMAGAYLGDITRVRVFYDGLEIDPLDPRTPGWLDLGSIPLWTAEEVRVERAADEVRVHIRSWRALRTTPYTRADVGTGDQETNLYRGFFGRRFDRGEALQVSAQQVSTTPARNGGSTNHSGVLARLGWAGGWWSVDGTLVRSTLGRSTIFSRLLTDTIPPVTATETNAYLRVAYGDPESGPWAQVIVSGQEYRFGGQRAADGDTTLNADTTRYEGQYVLGGGVAWRALKLSATERFRASEGKPYQSPSARASFLSPFVAASAVAELEGVGGDSRADATVRITPVRFLSVGGAYAVRRPAGSGVTSTTTRAEAALRVHELWLGGGVIRRAGASLTPPTIFNRQYEARSESEATGAFATVRGRVWGPFQADVIGIRWQEAGFYRPRYQARSELYVATTLPRRFPSGNFGLLASLQHEYRSDVRFPVADTVRRTGGYRTLSGLLEIRILQAVLTYQYRNMLVEEYSTVPDFRMPRQTQFYGVRWEFWN